MNTTSNCPVITLKSDTRAPRQHIVYNGTKSIGYVCQTLKCDGGMYYALLSVRETGPKQETLDEAVSDLCTYREAELKQHHKISELQRMHAEESWGHTYTPGMRQPNYPSPTRPAMKPDLIVVSQTPVRRIQVNNKKTQKPRYLEGPKPRVHVTKDGREIPVSYGKPAPPIKRCRLAGRKQPELVNGIGID